MSIPRSEAQIAAARANGAKSRGPVTETGKAISAQNAITHGLTARAVVLGHECPDQFNALLAELTAHWAPANPAEWLCVEQMAVAAWKTRRVWTLEKATLHRQFDQQPPVEGLDAPAHLSDAWDMTQRRLDSFSQHETRLDRLYSRVQTRLERLQARRAAAEAAQTKKILQNEPGNSLPEAA